MRSRFLLSLITMATISAAYVHAKTFPFLRLVDAKFMDVLETVGAPPARSSAGVHTDGSFRFQLEGTSGSRRHWKIAFEQDLRTKFELKFGVKTTNLATPTGTPAVYLVLSPRIPGPGRTAKRVPVFTVIGKNSSEIGTVELNTGDGNYRLDSLHFDLAVANAGAAELEITTFDLSYTGNLWDQDTCLKIASNKPDHLPEISKDLVYDQQLLKIGKQTLPLDGYAIITNPQPAIHRIMTEKAGFQLNHLYVNMNDPMFTPMPGYLEYAGLETWLRRVGNMPGYLVLDVKLDDLPAWWNQVNRTRNSQAKTDANKTYVEYNKNLLRQLMAIVRRGDLRNKIIGINLMLGHRDNMVPLLDRHLHPGFEKQFRAWLTEKYDTDKALQDTWGDKHATLTDVIFAPPSHWEPGFVGPLLNPAGQKQRLDSRDFYYQSWIKYHLEMNAYVKKIAPSMLCGFSGNMLRFMSGSWNNSHRPTGVIGTVCKSEAVDFVEFPRVAEDDWAYTTEQIVFERLRKAGKLIFLRNKVDPFHMRDSEVVGVEKIREFYAKVPLTVSGIIYETRRPVLFAKKWVRDEIQQQQDIRNRLCHARDEVPTEIAVVVDPEIADYTGPTRTMPMVEAEQIVGSISPNYAGKKASLDYYTHELSTFGWNRIGAPYDVVSIDELEPEDYRLFIFHHTVRMTEDRLDRINRLKKNGKTLIFSWIDGLLKEGSISPASLTDLTGIKLKMTTKFSQHLLLATSELDELLDKKKLEHAIGLAASAREPDRISTLRFSPTFQVGDTKADSLAVQVDTRSPALVRREFFRWTSIYSLSPVLSPELLRVLAEESDVHIYHRENDDLFFGDRYISFCARKSGEIELSLPEKSILYDVYADKELKRADEHKVSVQKGRNYLFFLGNKIDWMALAPNKKTAE